jgi:hypothetical protein
MNLLDVLNIEFPQLPTTIDKRGRLMLYNNLCENIINFAKTNELTPAETCACIYDLLKCYLQKTWKIFLIYLNQQIFG